MEEPIILGNRYRLLERLGSGGMAVVYRARDLTLERDVAVKLLRENYTHASAFQERFRQEAKAAANLSHPNIVTVHDFGYDAGRLYIVMEYIPGTDLKSILQRRGCFPIRETINLIIQACAGVGYAHRAGLVHCDIKSQNFIITPDYRLKVTDFGIARALASIQPDEKTDVVWGSPQYFSPEQAAGNPPSPASDVYSLGVVMYEMLTGRLPFISATAEELARMHREDPPHPHSRYNLAIPTMLEQILFKVLSKEPSNRYRTADQFGRVLVTYNKQTASQSSFPLSINSDNQSIETRKPTNKLSNPTSDHLQNRPQEASRDFPYPQSEVYAPNGEVRTNPLDIDWATVFLALLTLLAIGGLVPLWIWVYFLYQ